VFAYVAAFLYEQDTPLAERKAQALTLDRALLAELLGQEELRDLIDGDVLAALEAELQQLPQDYRARDADELHDTLRRLGDLDTEEIAARCEGSASEWLASLAGQRRATTVRIAGEDRWIAAEDTGLYRDAVGCNVPAGTPEAFLASVDEPLENLLRRYARHRGPFESGHPASRFGLPVAAVDTLLAVLESRGTLVRGEIRPGGTALEWCDAEVLRRLKRRNLAHLRNEVAPVDASALAIFLPQWQGAAGEKRRPLIEVMAQLQGLALPWTTWCDVVLPQRVAGFTVSQLDELAATGQLAWVGCGASGPRDGRVAFYLRRQVRDLLQPAPVPENLDALPRAILEVLTDEGASFPVDIEFSLRDRGQAFSQAEFREALWELAWAGQITNDTFAPLRELAGGEPRRRRPRYRPVEVPVAGRWALVSNLVPTPPADTRIAVARTQLLLERYGVVSRECLQAEDFAGGFGPIYRVLREMEEQGKVRRGLFIDGLSGAQFAVAGAVDRLRGCRLQSEERDTPPGPADVVALAATDPANPFGTLLPWPATSNENQPAPRRVAGAWLIMVRGTPVLYAGKRCRKLVTFQAADALGEGALATAIETLRNLPRGNRRSFPVIESIDDIPAADTGLLEQFRACGYLIDARPPGTPPDTNRVH
jgi:ATP-dependent Lhr-like helicase